MTRWAAVARSPAVRGAFLVVAVGAAVATLVTQREAVGRAVVEVSPLAVVASVAPGVVFLLCTLQAWRTVLADLGSPLAARPAFSLFFVSQLGKYVPGGVWNLVSAAELGVSHGIPRRRSLSAMGVATLVALASGVAVGTGLLVVAGSPGPPPPWAWVMLPLLVVALAPPVLNRLLAGALRLARRAPLERPVTNAGIGRAVAWALAGWGAVGAQIWLLVTALGVPPTVRAFLVCVGAYALAWIAGFVVVVAPAGVGAREVVLASLLPVGVTQGGVVLVVLLARVLQTGVELLLALVGWWVSPSRGPGPSADA